MGGRKLMTRSKIQAESVNLEADTFAFTGTVMTLLVEVHSGGHARGNADAWASISAGGGSFNFLMILLLDSFDTGIRYSTSRS